MRLIQAGLGAFGRSWAGIVRDTDGVEHVAMVEPIPEARDRAIADLGLPRSTVFPSLEEALAAVPADAVLLTTPPETHHPLTLEALAAGVHVLVEKPLAMNIAQAQEMIAAAAAANRTLMVSQNYRFRPPTRAAQTVVSSGVLGDLIAVRVDFQRDTRRIFPPGGFRFTMRHPLLVDMSIHHMDMLRAVTGREIESVYARSWAAPDSPYNHHPSVALTMALSGGATATYDGDWAGRDGDTSWNADWEFLGREGRLLWRGGLADDMTGDLTLERWGEPAESVPLPVLNAKDRGGSLVAFRDALAENAIPETAATDNIHSLAAILAAVQSADSGEVVRLDAPLNG